MPLGIPTFFPGPKKLKLFGLTYKHREKERKKTVKVGQDRCLGTQMDPLIHFVASILICSTLPTAAAMQICFPISNNEVFVK